MSIEPIRRAALNMLARRDHSQYELMRKLQAKGFLLADSKRLAIDLADRGLINEQRFTENYIYSRRSKGYGPERITLELTARGIANETIAEHLDMADNAWFAEARKVWNKYFKGHPPTDFKTRAKQQRFLQYRGFTREQIESVISA